MRDLIFVQVLHKPRRICQEVEKEMTDAGLSTIVDSVKKLLLPTLR